MKKRNLNINLLSSYEAPGVFAKINPIIKSKLNEFSETKERMEGCLAFCWHSSAQLPHDSEDDVEDAKSRQKYLRAELSEYASLEDAVVSDFESLGLKRPRAMYTFPDPRLHIVRMLRHVNVHMKTSGILKKPRPAIWTSPNGPVEFNHVNYIVDNLESISKVRDAEKYEADDLQHMIDWLELEQNEWGMPHLVFRTAELYVQEIFEVAGV